MEIKPSLSAGVKTFNIKKSVKSIHGSERVLVNKQNVPFREVFAPCRENQKCKTTFFTNTLV